jgi:hypothetical protein
MQYAIAVAGAAIFLIMLLFFPETIQTHEQGLEKLNASLDKPRRFVFINPFRSLTTLKAPTLFGLVSPFLNATTTCA